MGLNEGIKDGKKDRWVVEGMKESTAIAKEANRKQESSPTKSDNSIQRLRNEPERQLGSLRAVIGNIQRNGGTPSVESISTELSVMPYSDRASALLALQQTHGNHYVQRVVVGIQAKLKVGQPGDIYEREADRVADEVMRMSEAKMQRQVEPEEEEKELLQGKPLAEQITPLVQWQVEIEKEEEIQTKQLLSHAPEIIPDVETRINSIRGGGQPLGPETRPSMDQRFGHDFSKVRVHTHSQAAHSAAALKARAYTLGSNIVFGAGEYAPRTRSGRSLIAHELSHVVQQEGTPAATQEKLRISSPSDSAEQAADAAARATMVYDDHPYRSSALQLRDSLRTSSLPHPTIQRAVKTWGGEYDTDKYKLTKDPGMDGVDIELKFKPNKHVDAELIGMTQTARSLIKASPVPFKMYGKAEEKARKSRAIPSAEAAAGTFIDRISSYGNPLYATDKPSPGHTLADTPTVAFWGRHGWRYTDKAGKLQQQDALLKDRPQMPSGLKESSQTFETTALAVKGVQEGTFYGSVQWGWEKDAAGKVKKLPLSLVSRGVPSATFGRASELWNISKTSEGKETIDLPVVDVKVINRDDVKLYSNPIDAMIEIDPGTPLPRGTRIRVLDIWDPLIHQIEVVDGPMTGQRGYIGSLGRYRGERKMS